MSAMRGAAAAGSAARARRALGVAIARLALTWMVGGAMTPAVATVGDAERGRQLYDTGRAADGQPLKARRPGTGALSAAAVACVNCHRPSTMGGIEGGLLVPPIAGHVLFAKGRPPSTTMRMQWMRHQTRSAYDTALFDRALTRGLDPDGHALGPEMPRYALTAGQVADLDAYLRARGLEPVPGLKDGVLHLATVFAPDAPAARRDAVTKVMRAWSEGLRFGRTPVAWHAWTLTGPPDGWAAQLSDWSRRTPVFGLVSGAGGTEWQPVEDFCERQRIACLFPSLDRIPQRPTPPRFSTYLTAGVDGEARMLAAALADPARRPSELLQVWRGPAGAAAVARLTEAARGAAWKTQSVEWTGAPTAPLPPGSTVALWLDTEQVRAWLAAHRPGAVKAVYLSAQLAPALTLAIPAPWQPRVRWVSMRAAPVDFRGALALALEPWAQAVLARGDVAPIEFAEARAAAFLFGDAVGLSQGVLRPDYLIERLETGVRGRAAAAIVVEASLGPMQRVAAKGGYLLAFRPERQDVLVRASPYLRAVP